MTLHFAVLGDSIAYGQGASAPADTIGARLTVALRAAGVETGLKVLAAPRARSEALADQVSTAIGWPARLALIIVGANDLTHFVPIQRAATQLGNAVRSLRRADVAVVVTPAPDLSVVPWVPAEFRGLVQAASAGLRSAQARIAEAEGAVVADVSTALAAFAADPALFSGDHFHPSSAGYRVITQALLPTVLAAAQRFPTT